MNRTRDYKKCLDAYRSTRDNPISVSMVYNHMSNHYRRIINAKATIDSTHPQSLKNRECLNIHRNGSVGYSSNMNLYSDKLQSCNSYMQWKHSRQDDVYSYDKSAIPNKKTKSRVHNRRLQNDLLESHKNAFERAQQQFYPRLLKSNAESKIRDMRVYHPPRRRKVFEQSNWPDDESQQEDDPECQCNGECSCGQPIEILNTKESSQTSSRDSAYNGGAYSTPESRSPTPYRQKSDNSEKQVGLVDTATQTDHKGPIHDGKKERRKEPEYTRFIHEITTAVIENGSFTDGALDEIFHRHITANSKLEAEEMLLEINALRDRLGMSRITESKNEFATFKTKPDAVIGIIDDDVECESWTSIYRSLNSRASDVFCESGALNNTFVIEQSETCHTKTLETGLPFNELVNSDGNESASDEEKSTHD